jgi:hypothetical protein
MFFSGVLTALVLNLFSCLVLAEVVTICSILTFKYSKYVLLLNMKINFVKIKQFRIYYYYMYTIACGLKKKSIVLVSDI